MSIPSWAIRGAKIVRVEPVYAARHAASVVPVVGQTYTIREVFLAKGGRPAVRLVEITCSWSDARNYERGWVLSHFRPLVSLQDDISAHFEQHLRSPHKIEERV